MPTVFGGVGVPTSMTTMEVMRGTGLARAWVPSALRIPRFGHAMVTLPCK
jgi:hypothetical protein